MWREKNQSPPDEQTATGSSGYIAATVAAGNYHAARAWPPECGALPQSLLWGKTSHTARAAPRKKVAAARSPQSLLRGNISHTARPARITGCDAPLWGNLPQSQLWGKISHTARAPRARHSRCCAAPFLTRRAPQEKLPATRPYGVTCHSRSCGAKFLIRRAPLRKKLASRNSVRRALPVATVKNYHAAHLVLGKERRAVSAREKKSPQLMPSWKFSQARHHPCPHTYAPRQFHLPRNECQ